MKPNLRLCFPILIAALMSAGRLIQAAPPIPPRIPEPLASHLFTPDLLVKAAKHIGITPEQEQAMRADYAAFEPQAAETGEKLRKAMEALVSAVEPAKPDMEAALKCADDVLAAERELKRGQLALLIRLKSALSPEQQKQLRSIGERIRRLEAKQAEITEWVAKWRAAGRDLAPFQPFKEKAETALEAGDLDTVERIQDEVLAKLKAE